MNHRQRASSSTQARIAMTLSALVIAFAAASTATGEDAAIKLLFLGDLGHHEPAKRCAWITPTFAARGIQTTYSADVNDLNPTTLARYDVLMVYANIATITPEQEQALISFVEGGKGFAPIHCGSACFGNSPKAVALIGGRFKNHQTAVFAPVTVEPGHPIMRRFAGYEAWDETYVHADLNAEGRTVLAERIDNGVHEPWTWVRSQGQGRVFYTASGHDERVWQNAGFQELLVRGVAWAAGAKGQALLDSFAGAGVAKKDRVPLTYEPRPTVQNYEKRNPYPQYQFPLSAKDSQDYIQVEPGFELKLFAAEPDIVKPIALQWDHRGRLWVLETVDYPSNFTEQWQGHDRIVICEDTDGDGKADKFTVFAEGLNIATGMCFANGGVIVAQAPNLLFLKDTDGDDKADVKEVIMPGWSKGDTHAGPSNLHYGFDNWVYGCVGYAGFDGTLGVGGSIGRKQSFRQGPFRFTRAIDKLEFLGQYNNNTWGLGFNEAGELFGSTANNAHHFYTPIPIPYFKSTFGMDRDDKLFASVKMDGHYAAHPLTGKIRQVDVFGGFTAAAGQNLYTARAFPEKYWDRCTLVCEPTMHLLHQGFLKRDGSGWTEDGDGLNLLAAEDEWVAPVYADVGPDGAVWIADWYNFIIQHNPTPSAGHGGFDAKTGKGGAHENPLRDTQHGRIYRLVWSGAKPAAKLVLDPGNAAQLVGTLTNDNLFWRLTAQRLLVERGKTDVVTALIELTKDQTVDKVGVSGGVIHALWTLHGLGVLDGGNQPAFAAAVVALRHPSAAARRTAVQVLPPTADSAKALLASGILDDRELNVRLAAFLAASKLPATDELGAALFASSQRPEVSTDRWLPSALTVAAAAHAGGFIAAELKAGIKVPVADAGDTADKAANLIVNGSFEEVKDGVPTGWKERTYNGQATLRVVDGGRSGRCVEITSTAGADSSWFQSVAVKPRHSYRLSGWVKCRDVAGAMGGLFNVHLNDGKTAAVAGSKDWSRVTMDFDSGTATNVDINCLFGGWGRSTGTVWYDDVAVVELGAAGKGANAATSDRERIVARNLAHRATVSAQVALIDQLAVADPGLAGAMLDGLAAGWAEQEPPKAVDAKDRSTLVAAAPKFDANNQRRLGMIAERWGVREGLPGLAGQPPAVVSVKKDAVTPLPEAQQQRFESGKSRYLTLCVACHQPNGLGLPAVAPPLVGSEWVNGPESRLARIVLGGVQGPVVAAGSTFSLVMPPLKEALDDAAIAEILTYVRHEWGNNSPPVEAATVRAIRAAEKARQALWTAEELFKVP